MYSLRLKKYSIDIIIWDTDIGDEKFEGDNFVRHKISALTISLSLPYIKAE